MDVTHELWSPADKKDPQYILERGFGMDPLHLVVGAACLIYKNCLFAKGACFRRKTRNATTRGEKKMKMAKQVV